ncbi:hypothetical protein BKA82DRAFT_4103402 [Pisolithus tinctorius]|nr:hypothetical protein BKA82DRAFT_4103402 [Pisolithus tinctorius]
MRMLQRYDRFCVRSAVRCFCVYLVTGWSEGGEATLGIALDWVVEMAWFLFLVYVCVFPTIYHNLVLIPPAVVTRGSPLSFPQVIPHRCVRNSSPVSLTQQYTCIQLFIMQTQ